MKSVAFLSLVIFFSCLPKYSQQTFWRTTSTPLPSDPTAKIYQELQKIPTPQTTAQKIVDNFMRFQPGGRVGKRQIASQDEEDIVYVLDGSGSVGECEFNEGKKALTQLINICEQKGTVSCRHAGITFSDSAMRNFKFESRQQAIREMIAISYPGGGTNTQAGLAEAKKLFLDQNAGSRRFATPMVFLLTDGQSNVQKQLTIPNAQKLKNLRVKIYVVAVGNYITGIDEMAKVASSPPEKHVFRVEKNSDLQYVFELALKIIDKTYVPVKKPSPC